MSDLVSSNTHDTLETTTPAVLGSFVDELGPESVSLLVHAAGTRPVNSYKDFIIVNDQWLVLATTSR